MTKRADCIISTAGIMTRFINAVPNVDHGKFDEGAGLNGYNVFAYCANNPVMFKDDSGEFVVSISIGTYMDSLWNCYRGWCRCCDRHSCRE